MPAPCNVLGRSMPACSPLSSAGSPSGIRVTSHASLHNPPPPQWGSSGCLAPGAYTLLARFWWYCWALLASSARQQSLWQPGVNGERTAPAGKRAYLQMLHMILDFNWQNSSDPRDIGTDILSSQHSWTASSPAPSSLKGLPIYHFLQIATIKLLKLNGTLDTLRALRARYRDGRAVDFALCC